MSSARVYFFAAALLASVLSCAPKAAADPASISELNRQVAITLRSAVFAPHRAAFARPFSFDPDRLPAANAAGPLGRRFTLPAWAAPFARANRLLSVHAGDFQFDGWGALVPRGVVRLKYTVRV